MRIDPVAAFERTIATTNKIISIANRLDSQELFAMIKEDKTVAILKWMEERVLA